MGGRRVVGAVLAFLVAVVGAAGPASADPTIELSALAVSLGDTVVVTLSGWSAATTVAVCGNAARRGGVDCDQVGGIGIPASLNGPQRQPLVISRPPAPCPCVVRASTAGETLVRTVSIKVAGLPTAPVVDPAVPPSELEVTATVRAADASLFTRLQSALGGRTKRTLLLTLTNHGDAALDGISGIAAVARSTQGGEPLQLPSLGPIAPGQTREYRVPVSISAPSFGSYVVYGSVYGAGTPVVFAAYTRTTPWALFVVIVVLVVDLGVIFTLRRRRRAATGWPRSGDKATARQTEVEQTSEGASAAGRPNIVGGDASVDELGRFDAH